MEKLWNGLQSAHVTAALGIGAAGLVALWVASHRRPRGSPPGPTRIPFIGTTALSGDRDKFIDEMNKLLKEYGNIFSFYVGDR